jgi:cyclic pyranopterin phosphate synthase
MPVPGDSLVGERLHVCVGATCNNNCVFCMERDRESRFRRLTAQTADDVRRMMTADSPAREVMFTSGEPTLHPDLPAYVAMARDLGFETIGLITNGRRFAYKPYARSLLDAGLNHVLVSIHGPDAKTHDALTRTRGAFDQAVAGLANLTVLRREFPGLKVHTSYVVNKRNVTLFRAFYDAMLPFRVHQHVFNVMMPDGRGGEHFDALMCRYSEVASEFGRFVAGLPPEGVARVFLLDIPYCTTEALPSVVRGYVERYFHFEPEPDRAAAGDAPRPEGRSTVDGDAGRYAVVAKSDRDADVRTKRAQCAGCGYSRHCRGVFVNYIERFGWDEFMPVRDAPTGD